MAEYDGSIRIGVKVDQQNAQKQLENLKKRLASQTLEIGKQSKAAEKLRSKLAEIAQKTGKPEFVQDLVSAPMIKCKKTPKKKCSLVAKEAKKR